jgi:hypothetical protein
MANADTDVESWDDEKLDVSRQGCTELTCPYHGPINMEIRKRQKLGTWTR